MTEQNHIEVGENTGEFELDLSDKELRHTLSVFDEDKNPAVTLAAVRSALGCEPGLVIHLISSFEEDEEDEEEWTRQVVTDKLPVPKDKISPGTWKALREKETKEFEEAIRAVKREAEVAVVADLHGSFRAYEGDLLETRLVNSTLNWIGGNSILVFLGDLLADRNSDGFKVLKHMAFLREEARLCGGDIRFVLGNHENYVMHLLTTGGEGVIPERAGAAEFLKFGFKPGMGEEQRMISLRTMQNDPEGLLVLESLCEMKLVSVVDDTLFTHTPLTRRMLAIIKIVGSEELNTFFQADQRRTFLGEGEPYLSFGLRKMIAENKDTLDLLGVGDILSEYYPSWSDWRVLRNIFLHTNNSALESRHHNQFKFSPVLYSAAEFYEDIFLKASDAEKLEYERTSRSAAKILKELGINRLFNGHDGIVTKEHSFGIGRYCIDSRFRQYEKDFGVLVSPAVLNIKKDGTLFGLGKFDF